MIRIKRKPKTQALFEYLGVLGILVSTWGGAFGPLIAQPFQQAVCEITPKLSSKAHRVPQGAIWKKESFPLPADAVPVEYKAAVGWVNIAAAVPCNVPSKPALVEIREFRVIEQDPETKAETVIQTITFNENRDGFRSALFPRLPVWFGPGKGDEISSWSRLELFQDQSLRIDMTRSPRQIYHGWSHPRAEVMPGKRHIVEAEVRISGAARLQLGLDYWRDTVVDYQGYDRTCQTSNNCEAWIGKWQGDTKGEWITLRSPKEFQ